MPPSFADDHPALWLVMVLLAPALLGAAAGEAAAPDGYSGLGAAVGFFLALVLLPCGFVLLMVLAGEMP